jgi:hypothetical protein
MCDLALQFWQSSSSLIPKNSLDLKIGGKGTFSGIQYILKVVRCPNIDCKMQWKTVL